MDQVTFEMRTSQHDSYLTNYVLCSHFLSKDYLVCYAKSPRILLHTFLLWPPGCNRISLAVIRRNLRRLELRCKPNEDAKREEILPWIYWTARQALLYFSWNIPIKIVHCYSVTHWTFSRIIFLFWNIEIIVLPAQGVWNPQKKSLSTLRVKRALFTFWVDKTQKFIKKDKDGQFWRVFENLKLSVKQCYQTGQF